MNESYKRGLYRHERRESGRGTEQQRNGRAHVKADVDDETSHTCSLYAFAEEIGQRTYASLSPPPILSTPFCSISFITVCWLRNQAIVQLLDHEGQH